MYLTNQDSSLIRIALFSRRDTIATMRLVGAKSSFISRPFRLRSLAYGAIGGFIADVLIAVTLWAFSNQFGVDLLAQTHLLWYALIAVAVILVGIIISYLATIATVRRYTRKIEN